MAPIISIVGVKNCGKTTLIEKLIPELRSRGYRVGSVKHDVHGFNIDHEGKDSWRHSQAGSITTVISSPNKVAVVEKVDNELTLDDITGRYFRGLDLILTEGYKRESTTKIEIFRKGVSKEIISPAEQLLFIAADTDSNFDEVPIVDLNDVKTMADIIVRNLKLLDKDGVSLTANGKIVPLNRIMRNMVISAVGGLISSLKGVNHPRDIEIRIHNAAKKSLSNSPEQQPD